MKIGGFDGKPEAFRKGSGKAAKAESRRELRKRWGRKPVWC
jgi:hypothetical protein